MAGYSQNHNTYYQNSGSKVPTVTMYHSTNAEGAKGIRKERVIQESSHSNKKTGGDMLMGQGVYLHPHNPRHVPKEHIAWNNYDDGQKVWGKKLEEGKGDYFVKVKVPMDRLERLSGNSGRQVYKHDGPMDLDEYSGRVYKVPDGRQSNK